MNSSPFYTVGFLDTTCWTGRAAGRYRIDGHHGGDAGRKARYGGIVKDLLAETFCRDDGPYRTWYGRDELGTEVKEGGIMQVVPPFL